MTFLVIVFVTVCLCNKAGVKGTAFSVRLLSKAGVKGTALSVLQISGFLPITTSFLNLFRMCVQEFVK